MLRLFKSPGPLGIFLLLAYTALLRLYQFQPDAQWLVMPNKPAPLFELFVHGLKSAGIHHPLTYFVLSTLLVLGQAISLNGLIDRHKIFVRPYWLPAFSYVLLTSLFPEASSFSPALLANSLLLLIFSRLFGTFRRDKCDRDLFDIGFFLGLTILVYPPAFIWVLFVVFSMLILRPFRIKEFFIALTGLLNPYFLVWVVIYAAALNYKLTDHLYALFEVRWVVDFSIGWLGIVQAVILLTTAFIGWVTIQSQFNTFTIQVRNFLNLLILFTGIAVLSLLWTDAISMDKMLPAAIPMAVFQLKVIRDMRWPLLAEIIHLLLLAATVYREFFI